MSTPESLRLPHSTDASAPPKRPGLILAFLCLAGFMTFLDVSIVNVALPTIEDELHISQTSLQYIVTSYGLLRGGFVPDRPARETSPSAVPLKHRGTGARPPTAPEAEGRRRP